MGMPQAGPMRVGGEAGHKEFEHAVLADQEPGGGGWISPGQRRWSAAQGTGWERAELSWRGFVSQRLCTPGKATWLPRPQFPVAADQHLRWGCCQQNRMNAGPPPDKSFISESGDYPHHCYSEGTELTGTLGRRKARGREEKLPGQVTQMQADTCMLHAACGQEPWLPPWLHGAGRAASSHAKPSASTPCPVHGQCGVMVTRLDHRAA